MAMCTDTTVNTVGCSQAASLHRSTRLRDMSQTTDTPACCWHANRGLCMAKDNCGGPQDACSRDGINPKTTKCNAHMWVGLWQAPTNPAVETIGATYTHRRMHSMCQGSCTPPNPHLLAKHHMPRHREIDSAAADAPRHSRMLLRALCWNPDMSKGSA